MSTTAYPSTHQRFEQFTEQELSSMRAALYLVPDTRYDHSEAKRMIDQITRVLVERT